MVDNLIKGVVLGVLIMVWYYAGVAVPWLNLGAFSVAGIGGDYMFVDLGYLFFTVLAFGLVRSGK
jgi:hypothetical protein